MTVQAATAPFKGPGKIPGDTSREDHGNGHGNEHGAIIVISALMITTLLGVAALVLDMGLLRMNATKLQSAADLAVAAGGQDLGAGDPVTACQKTINYLNTNIADMVTINATSFCSQSGNNVGQTTCSGAAFPAQATPTITAGPYRVTLQFPVTDAQIQDRKRTIVGLNDGTPCERMRIVVNGTQSTLFAGVLGVKGLSVARSATVRGYMGTQQDVPALWLLDPIGCVALDVNASNLTVGTAANPGIIVLDSDGSGCSSNQSTISATGGALLQAVPLSGASVGRIILRAQSTSATVCTPRACDPLDVSAGRLLPQPTGTSQRATRAPVDWRYNCKNTGYPGYPVYLPIVTVPPCPTAATTPPYIDNLTTAVTASGNPGGFSRWRAVYSCNPPGTVTVPAGNWWIDCPSGLSIGNGTNVTFTGGNIVMDDALKMTGGTFTVNNANPTPSLTPSCKPPTLAIPCPTASSAGAAFVYLRSGDISVTGGAAFALTNTFVYQAAGALNINSTGTQRWTAPTEGPFTGLSYWSETKAPYTLSGGTGVVLGGVFFTPYAEPFKLAGGGNWGQQSAQFISYRLTVTGGSTAILSPDPSAIALPPKRALIIR